MHDPLGTLDIAGQTIEKVANPGSRKNFGKNTAHYTAVGGALFPALPSPGDIKQQELADCYVLSAVLAILARDGGPEVVQGMMRDRGNDVVVRLYDATGTARFVAIERSIRKNANKHNGGAIWASLLEKAYAAAAFVEEGKKFAESGKPAAGNAPLVTGWAKLNFGSSTDAFQVLLGTKGTDSGLDKALISGKTADSMMFRYLFSVEKTSKIHETVRAKLRDTIFKGDGAKLDQLLQWRTQHVLHAWKTLMAAFGELDQDAPKPKGPTPRKAMRLDDLAGFLSSHALPAKVISDIMDFVEAKQLLPGRRGTGVYSTAQLSAFDRIKGALTAKKPVTLGTQDSVGSVVTRKGLSGGESIVKGLAASHAYSVLSVREETTAPRRKWVRVRNPWGETGRGYVPSTKGSPDALKAVEITSAEFDLELSDLVKRFEKIYIGGVAIQG